MLTIEVELLTGRYVASDYHEREKPEWPPHPARLYSALVATWAEVFDSDPAFTSALDELAALPPPTLRFSSASRRQQGVNYVPVNDASVLSASQQVNRYNELRTAKAVLDEARAQLARATTSADVKKATKAVERAVKKVEKARDKAVAFATAELTKVPKNIDVSVLPEHRTRQGRFYPSVTPEDPIVAYQWDAAEFTDRDRTSIATLLGAVSRLGHSSSLVRCALRDPVEPLYEPDEEGDLDVRWVREGQREALQRRHDHHGGIEPRVLPFLPVRYRAVDTMKRHAVARPVEGANWFVLERVGDLRLPIQRAPDVAEAVHRALVAWADEPVHPAVSGRDPDGRPTRAPHVAVVALPFVGRPHADGSLLGVALRLPEDLEAEARRAVLRAVGHWSEAQPDGLEVRMGRAGVFRLARVVGQPRLWNLREATWRGPAHHWVSTLPIALDRHPGALDATDPTRAHEAEARARASIERACERVGAPHPVHIDITPAPTLHGGRHVRDHGPWPRQQRPGKPRRMLVHARITFAEAVEGPLVLGAGRFRGLGLMRPWGNDR